MKLFALGLLISLSLAGCDPVSSTADPVVELAGFSWVVGDALAGMPHPYAEHRGFLDAQSVKVVISLTEDVPEWLHGEFETLHLPIEDFQPPTLLQQLRFVDAVERHQQAGVPVAVHCTAGRGRTGTLLATWFVADGMTSAQAIAHVRQLRPGSIETPAQEAQIELFALYLAGL